ncbi:MAG: MipA/OmpV family protein, partial [Solimonas sp.]
AAALASAGSFGPVLAADGGEPSSRLMVGVGAALQQQAYEGIDADILPLPLISYENRWIAVGVPSLDFKLLSDGPLRFALRASYARDGYDASDAPILAGMDKRKDSFWGGAALRWDAGIAVLSAQWLTDLSGYSEGQKASLSIERSFTAGRFIFTPRAGASWQDSKFIDYYYGVKPSEARAGRPAYTGESSIGFQTGLRTAYLLNSKQSVFVDAGIELLGREIEDSPLVDQAMEYRVMLGYLYRFR